jgi:hypothetical protein
MGRVLGVMTQLLTEGKVPLAVLDLHHPLPVAGDALEGSQVYPVLNGVRLDSTEGHPLQAARALEDDIGETSSVTSAPD